MTRQFVKLNKNATLPERATEYSAGYDISASETVTIQPDEIKMVSTGLAVQLGDDEVLKLYDRSSNPVKRGIALINSVGIIDSDYYPNEFKGLFMNISKEPVTISKGQRIMQGVFVKYLSLIHIVKRGIALINSVGIIDSDYYPNEFKGLFMNISKEPVTISKGQRIMQGVFVKYLTTDDDNANGKRTGGFGSSDKH
ncbi:deoxyuridine 5'-triphosphate nucleotidohydrolase [Lactococcus phage D4044]|nr:deoxyuridine 5'-triphosphate nucleotidohydrolase [Lactococcus phage D4044]